MGPITFAGLTGKPAITDLWAEDYAGEVHVELGDWADAMDSFTRWYGDACAVYAFC